MARISNDIIEQCRKMYEEDHIPCAQIAKHFGIGSATIRRRLKNIDKKISNVYRKKWMNLKTNKIYIRTIWIKVIRIGEKYVEIQ